MAFALLELRVFRAQLVREPLLPISQRKTIVLPHRQIAFGRVRIEVKYAHTFKKQRKILLIVSPPTFADQPIAHGCRMYQDAWVCNIDEVHGCGLKPDMTGSAPHLPDFVGSYQRLGLYHQRLFDLSLLAGAVAAPLLQWCELHVSFYVVEVAGCDAVSEPIGYKAVVWPVAK